MNYNEKTKRIQEWAPIILPAIIAYKNTPIEDKIGKERFKQAVKRNYEYYTNTLTPNISKAANKYALLNNIDLPKIKTGTYTRKQVGGVQGKPALVFEHSNTKQTVFKELILCNTLDDVITVLSVFSEVCWITRSEDNELNYAGFRSERTKGWEYCYSLCGIELLK